MQLSDVNWYLGDQPGQERLMSISGRGWARLLGTASVWTCGLAVPSNRALGQSDSVPPATAGPGGFTIQSREGSFQFRLRGYIQADGRFFPDVPANLGASTFLLRRARPVMDVTTWRYFTLRLTPDFGQGKVTLFDAYLDFRPVSHAGLRFGKMKPPVGLERLQPAIDLRFAERALPTNLVPTRDVGAQLFYEKPIVSVAAGVFNGVPDFGNGDIDGTNDKDFEARVFFHVPHVGVGIAGTTGQEHGTITAPALPSYVTPGQQPMFRYRDTTIANGTRSRITPQGYFYFGPFGLLGEYVRSAQRVSRTTATADLANSSWQIAASVFVTGERASFATVSPRHKFDPAAHHWGAIELAARYSELSIDPAAFPTFANVANSPTKTTAWAVGATWHLAPAVKIALNYELAQFSGGAAGGDRAPEHFLVTRFQQAF